MTIAFRTAATLGALMLWTAMVGSASAEPLTFPEQSLTTTVLSIPITVPISADLDGRAENGMQVVSGTVTASLADLQAHALQIVQRVPVPKEPCANQNGLNAVVALSDAALIPDGKGARLSVAGQVVAFGCLMGIGAPVANTVLAASAPVEFNVVSPTELRLKLSGPVEFSAAGLPGELLTPLSDQLNAGIQRALDEAVIKTNAPEAFPNIPDLEIQVESAEFFADVDTLMMRATGAATMKPATYDALRTQLGITP